MDIDFSRLASLEDGIFKSVESIAPVAGEHGYTVNRDGIEGKMLLSHRNLGVNLVYRLKDTRPLLVDEIVFWGKQVSTLASGDFDYVTTPPDSGKVPIDEHLASMLARVVAKEIGFEFRRVFRREAKSHQRRVGVAKRRDDSRFIYSGGVDRVLIVDDVLYTRATAKKCMAALPDGAAVQFLFLYGN